MKTFAMYFLMIVLFSLLMATEALAGTITSAATGNWTSGGTWVGGVAPAASDDVIIATGHTVSTNGNQTCASVTITGTLSMASGNVLTVNGNVSGAGTWTTGGSGSTRTISLTGSWSFNGSSTGTQNTVTFTGTSDQTLSGIIRTSTGTCNLIINKSSGSVVLGNALTVSGAFTMTAGTFDASTSLLTVNGAATLNAGTLRVGAATWGGNYSFTPATLSAGLVIDYYNANPSILSGITYQNLIFSGSGTAGASGALTIQGNLTKTGGGVLNFGSNAVTLNGSVAANTIAGFTTSGGVTVSKSSGMVTTNGIMSLGTLTISNAAATLKLGGDMSVTGLLSVIAGTIDPAMYKVSPGTFTVGATGIIIVSDALFANNYNIPPTSTPTSGSLFNYTAANPTISSAITYQVLQFSGTGTATVDGTLTIQDDLTTSGGSYNFGSNAVVLSGGLAQSIAGFTTTGSLTISKTGGTATFTGNTNAGSLVYSPTANNTTVALNAGVNLVLTNDLSIPKASANSNTFAIGAATVTCANVNLGANTGAIKSLITIATGSLTVPGNITASGTSSEIDITGAGYVNVGGSFMAGTGGTFSKGLSGTVNYNAEGAQTVSNYSYENLTLSGSGVKTLPTGITSIAGDFTVAGSASVTTVANLSVGGNLLLGASTVFATGSNLTLSITSATTISGTLSLGGTGSKSFTGNIVVNAGGGWNETGIATITIAGSLKNDGTILTSVFVEHKKRLNCS